MNARVAVIQIALLSFALSCGAFLNAGSGGSAVLGSVWSGLSPSTLNIPPSKCITREQQGFPSKTSLYGIPKMFRWLTDQYPSVNQRISEGLSKDVQEIDNLYLDMNGIIHM